VILAGKRWNGKIGTERKHHPLEVMQ